MQHRTLQVRVVKDATPTTATTRAASTPEPAVDYVQVVQESVKVVVIGFVIVSAVTTILHTISEITVSKFQ